MVFGGTAPQDCPGARKGGCAAAAGTLQGALAVVLKGQLPARGKRAGGGKGVKREPTGKEGWGPEMETLGQKPEAARLPGSQDRPEGGGRLKSEPREQLRALGVGMGGRRSKLLQVVVIIFLPFPEADTNGRGRGEAV